MLTVPGFEGVDGSFGDLGHCTPRFSLPVGNRMGTHRMQIGVYYSQRLSGRKDPNAMNYMHYLMTSAAKSRHETPIRDDCRSAGGCVPWEGTVPQRVRIPTGKLEFQSVATGEGDGDNDILRSTPTEGPPRPAGPATLRSVTRMPSRPGTEKRGS